MIIFFSLSTDRIDAAKHIAGRANFQRQKIRITSKTTGESKIVMTIQSNHNDFFEQKYIWLEMLHFKCIQFYFFGLFHFFELLHGEQNENQFQYQQPASLQLMVAIEIRNILLRYPLDHVGIKFSLVPNMQK